MARAYDASNRQAAARATRDRILQSAEDLFTARGYAGTSISAVAAAAGVATATVYLAFPTKGALLDGAILRATQAAGESFAAVLSAPPDQLLTRLAESQAQTMARAARIISVGEGALLTDPALQPTRDRAHANLRSAFSAVAARLDEAGLLRVPAPEATATLYTLANETTFLRSGLSAEEYATWLSTTLNAVLLA